MTIIYRTGDVVEAFKNGEIDVLVHGVNCQGKMNSGIAKQIRAEFPEVFERYEQRVMAHISDRNTLLGDTQWIPFENGRQEIVNAFTQAGYGYEGEKYCSYDAIDKAMLHISEVTYVSKVGMPKIGAGLGGGDWKVIEAIINGHFPDREVYVYELE